MTIYYLKDELLKGIAELDEVLFWLGDSSEARKKWVAHARYLAVEICKAKGTVTSVDVKRHLPVPEGWDPRILGAVFASRQEGFLFEVDHYQPTTDRQAHARPIPVWRFKNGSE